MKNRFVLRNLKKITGENIDIVIENGKIVEITNAGEGQAPQEFDKTGMYISSGWIDLHTHAYSKFSPYGDDLDSIGVKQGVTTVVDAGSCGSDNIDELITSSEKCVSRLFAFLNISRIGLKRVDELSNMDWIDIEKAVATVHNYQEYIVGLKARISASVVSNNGVAPLRIAKSLSNKTLLPLMVHIGSGPPPIKEIMPFLDKNDIVTHFLNGKENNLFDEEGYPIPDFVKAIDRGIHLDVGHGTSSFSFKVSELAKENGIRFNTISTDIYRKNRLNGPVYSMSNVLSKFLYLGYSLKEIIDAVTVNAAEWLQKPELGRIKLGDDANLTLFTVENNPVTFIDSEGIKRNATREIKAKGVVVNDQHIEC